MGRPCIHTDRWTRWFYYCQKSYKLAFCSIKRSSKATELFPPQCQSRALRCEVKCAFYWLLEYRSQVVVVVTGPERGVFDRRLDLYWHHKLLTMTTTWGRPRRRYTATKRDKWTTAACHNQHCLSQFNSSTLQTQGPKITRSQTASANSAPCTSCMSVETH